VIVFCVFAVELYEKA